MRLCFWGTLCGRIGLCWRGALWAGQGRAGDITKSGKAKFHKTFHRELWSILCGLQRPWYWKMTTCISLPLFVVQRSSNQRHMSTLPEVTGSIKQIAANSQNRHVASLRRCAASSRHHLLRWPRPGHLGEGCWGAIHGKPEMQMQQRCKFKHFKRIHAAGRFEGIHNLPYPAYPSLTVIQDVWRAHATLFEVCLPTCAACVCHSFERGPRISCSFCQPLEGKAMRLCNESYKFRTYITCTRIAWFTRVHRNHFASDIEDALQRGDH